VNTDPIARVRQTLTERNLLPPEGGLVVVGYSGGADSTALLHILTQLQAELMIRVHAGHLHHGMRPEADQDVEICQTVCKAIGVPFHWERVDVPALARREGLTFEEAGRTTRYAFLERLAEALGAVAIATAHTRTDQIETILINLLRGTGPRGLCGMPYRRGRIIRPLLDVTREETHTYCQAHQLPTVFDSTNTDPHQLRYRIRSQLRPLLQTLAPTYERHLLRLADILENEESWWGYYLHQHFGRCLQEGARLPTEMVRRQHPAVQRRILREWLRAHVGTLSLPPYAVLESIRRALLDGRTTSWQITAHHRLLTHPHYAEILPVETPLDLEYESPLELGSPTLLPQVGMWVEAERLDLAPDERERLLAIAKVQTEDGWEAFIDADAVHGSLSVRNWRQGDRFQPLGMAPSKKVSRIFMDRKVPIAQRRTLPLLCDEAGILWIPGYTVAHRARLTPQTLRVLHVRLHRNDSDTYASDLTKWNRQEP